MVHTLLGSTSGMNEGVKEHLAIALDWEFREGERATATERLGHLGDPNVVVPLGVLLGQTTPGRLRSALLFTLSRLSAVDAMIDGLRSPDPAARELAAQILANIKDDRAVPSLVEALNDPMPRVREEAAASLLEFRSLEALPALARVVVEDPDPDVRMAAAQALGELDDRAALDALERAMEREQDEFTLILIEQSIQRLMDRAYSVGS